MKIDTATLRLFKALPITTKKKKINKPLLKITISRGYIFSPEVIANYTDYNGLMDLVEEIYGITAEKLNSSFHKSWAKIKDTSQEELMVEQLAHYLTTYGKEAPGEYLIEKEEQFGVPHLVEKIIELPDFESDKIREENYVYIPKEALHIPHWDKENIKLIVIKGYTKLELEIKLMELLASGIAMKEETVLDCVEVAKFVGLNEGQIPLVKNKEVKIALYDHLGLVPENPVAFLRYVVYKATGKTLLIKNETLIKAIKEAEDKTAYGSFMKYKAEYGLEKLSEIFYRFRPIFMAFKADEKLRPAVNRISHKAVKYHKPMPEDYLNTVTAKLKGDKFLKYGKLRYELERVNTFRKIRLGYALKFRTKDVESIIYRIRNGRGWATDFEFRNKEKADTALAIVLDSIVEDVKKNVNGKRIYIPDHIQYALPATEKQFTGNFPSGTYVSVPKDIIFGINWGNVDSHRIDLDLSLISPIEGKIGWDAIYRTEGGSILFSGDITDARGPNGATELFYVKRQKKEALILLVNYYNFEEGVEVPFKIIVAQERVRNWKENYMVNPNNLIAVSNSKIAQKEKILGLLVTTFDECRFYFTETSTGTSITSSTSPVAEHSRKYLFGFYENTISLNDVLIKAGAKIVTQKGKTIDIDLSPEALEKTSILSLLRK